MPNEILLFWKQLQFYLLIQIVYPTLTIHHLQNITGTLL